ncbi:MAG TPA: thioredoxin family protein [Bacilli bacterium]|nr:thioredoxin family protein [Bacilli bacterium]
MKIQAIGCGCPKSTKNYQAVVQAAQELGITDEVEFYQDQEGMLAMGIISTPALVIDNRIYASGRVLNVSQAKELIAKAIAFSKKA